MTLRQLFGYEPPVPCCDFRSGHLDSSPCDRCGECMAHAARDLAAIRLQRDAAQKQLHVATNELLASRSAHRAAVVRGDQYAADVDRLMAQLAVARRKQPLVDLLPLLRHHGVSGYTADGVTLTFGATPILSEYVAPDGVRLSDTETRQNGFTSIEELHNVPGENCACGHERSQHNGVACGEGCDWWMCAGMKEAPAEMPDAAE